MVEMIALIVGGLVFFLFAINQLSVNFREAFSDRAKSLISKYASNTFIGLLIGTAVTVLLGSSSAVIIITLIFINAETLGFKQAMSIILGANIGTTFSSQIIAMDIGPYAAIPLLIGMIIKLAASDPKTARTGKIILYFGMLFFGLFLMETAVIPLKDDPTLKNWIATLESPWQGALIGGFVTLVIQSSSATVGIAITLGKQQMISIAGGIAVMIGAELGTCSDTLLATIGGSRQTVKAGVFHLVFNLTTIVIGLLLFEPFVQLVEFVTTTDSIDNHIANAHMLFNTIGVLLVLPFLGLIQRFFNWVIPELDKKSGGIKE